MGLWWLCCPIGSGMRTAFIEDGPANGLLENGDDGPRALQHQDGGADASTEEEPPQTRGRARTEDSTTAALLPSEARATNGAPTHRRTTSSRWVHPAPTSCRATGTRATLALALSLALT